MEQLNQYFMYGILVPYDKFKDWNLDANDDDISCIFNGRDGKFLIIGKIKFYQFWHVAKCGFDIF